MDLTEIERAVRGPAAPSLEARLEQLQLAQIAHGCRAIILFEGYDGSGQRSALRRVTSAWDPCHFIAYCDPPGDDGGRHWLAPYWSALPVAGCSALFHRSWYRRLADERALGRIDDKVWARRCDEVNEFEAQQCDHGTQLIKLFFDVSAGEQDARLALRRADPWRPPQGVAGPAPLRETLQASWTDLLAATDTRWASWTKIDADDGEAAERKALTVIAEAFENAVPRDPPLVNNAD